MSTAAPGRTIGVLCFPSIGGSGVIASELAVGLARRGHRLHIFATAPPSRPLPACERLTFHRIPVAPYPLFEHAPYDLAAASTIVEVARAERLDLLHVHYAVPHSTSAYLARQILGAAAPNAAPKVVTSLHGTDVTTVGADPSYREVTRFTVAASDGVVVPSRSLEVAARALLGSTSAPHIEVIPNFVDTQRFAPALRPDPARLHALFGGDGRGPTLFHVSNFRAVKRTTDLVEVLARVRRAVPARMVLVGDGPERAATEARARALGLAEATVFLGKQDGFVELLQHADAFVLPSHSESFGVAALEALSAGVPVFGYRVGGLPELVTPEVGRLVEPHDVDALAAALIAALRDPTTRSSLAAAARARALAEFRIEPALDRYEAYFDRVIAGLERR